MTRRPAIVVENLSARQGGGQTYLVNLFRHLPATLTQRFRIVAIVPDALLPALEHIAGLETLAPKVAQKSVVHRLIWQRLRLPRLLRDLDAVVVYCPGGLLSAGPGTRYRRVVAFRNMLPFANSEFWRYPPGYQRVRNFLLRRAQSRSFRDADAVVFVSRFAKSVIDGFVPDRKGKSIVVPHGIPGRFRVDEQPPVGIAGGSEYCLYVSSYDVYKAHLEVIEAWRRLRERRETPEKLVFAGPGNLRYRKTVEARIEEQGLKEHVIVLDEVPYADLPALYQGAKLNIFASSCENCPNILLEALASGRPVLCSNHQPMPEFGGDAVVYFDPYDPEELAARLLELLDDESAQRHWSEAARRQSMKFDWTDAAARTWAFLESLSDEKPST